MHAKTPVTGKVYLVGAGPGDTELLTLKAVRVLGAADVVLVDDLVNRDVLRHARRDARVIEVGKRGGAEPDWAALRATGTTLVIYMGLKRVATLVAGMLDAGFPVDTPACAIENGTLEAQREIVTTLRELPAATARARIGSPAILVIGEVVRYAHIAAASTVERAA